MDTSSSIEEEMSHVRLEAQRLGRVVVGDPIVVETAGPDGVTGWWLSVMVERPTSPSDGFALATA